MWQAETNSVPRSLGQALRVVLCWPRVHFCREISDASGAARSWGIAMATRGPSPELYSKLLSQEWAADNLRKCKLEHSYSLSLFFTPSFLMLWFWSSKRPIHSPPKLFWVPFTSLSDVPSDSWVLVRWGIGIELAQSGSLGGDPPCRTLARLAEWRGVSEEGTLGQTHLTLLKGIHDPVTRLSGGEHNQEREVVMSGSFLDLELC